MMIIDGTNTILGRVASYAAKQALLGETIAIVNCESIVVTGPRMYQRAELQRRHDMGGPYSGPFMYRMPDRYVKRAIRGMLPYKQERGRTAYDRIKCYLGVPEQFRQGPFHDVPSASAAKLKTLNRLTIRDLARAMGKNI